MNIALASCLALVAAATISCGGNGNDNAASTSAAATRAPSTATRPASAATAGTTATAGPARTPAQTTEAATPAPGDAIEVTGIVGSVNAASRSIEINRLSGAAVNHITLEPASVIRKATGGTTQLTNIRPSDRIVARGRLSDRGDALVAAEITVQDVVPGASPGG